VRTGRAKGKLTIAEALDRLLAGTGYLALQVGPRAWRIERQPTPTPSPASAPSPVQLDVVDTTPIVVTATKQPLAYFDLPMAVSVVPLGERDSHDPTAATATVAAATDGMALTGQGPGRNRIFLHGVADSPFPGSSQSTVAVVLDEARLTYSAPDPDIRLIDMERVEVLKGPQGSLYGVGVLGGIYRLVTRAPDLEDTRAQVSAGASSVASGAMGSSVSAVGNLPLVRDRVALRLVGYGAIEPGWIDTGSRRDSDRTRVSGARGTLGIAPGGDWRVDVTGFGQWLNSGDSRYVYSSGKRSRPDQLPEPHDNDLSHVALRATGSIGAAALTLATGVTWHEVGDTYDATQGAEDFGVPAPLRLLDQRKYRTWDSELRLRGTSGKLGWLVGLSYLSARQAVTDSLTSAVQPAQILSQDRRVSDDSAVFFNLTRPLTARLTLEAGARLFHSAIGEDRGLVRDTTHREFRRTGVTPDVSLSWRPSRRDMIYLRYGSAFRQGGLAFSAAGKLAALDGDELATVEGGWRRHLAGGGRLEVAAWHSWWSDIQSDALGQNGLIETINAGDGRILGTEVSFDVPLARSWHLEGGANVTSALLTRNALGRKLEDRHLPAVPEYTTRLALRHGFALGAADIALKAGLGFVGPSRMNFDPLLDRRYGKIWDSNAELHARWDRWDLSLAGSNLLGGTRSVFGYGNPLRYRTTSQFTPQPPRSVSLTLAASF